MKGVKSMGFKSVAASQYQNDYEYKRDRDEERKADKAKRDQRRERKDRWVPKGADE